MGRLCLSTLAWERLGIPPSELINVAREREVWAPLLELLPSDPTPDKRIDEDDSVVVFQIKLVRK